MRLYEIDEAMLNILDNIEIDENGEINSSKLDSINIERINKLENLGLYIKDLENFIGELKNEEATLKERRLVKENKLENLKKYAAQSIFALGAIETAKIKMTIIKSESVEITDIEKLPKEFVNEKTTVAADKTKIKQAIQNGQTIDGAILNQKINLKIK